MSSIKQESDEPNYSPPSTPHPAHAPHAPNVANAASAAAATAATGTSVLDNHLAASDFEKKICLVRTEGVSGKLLLRPALRFANMGDLQDAVDDVKASEDTVAHLGNKIHQKGKKLMKGRNGKDDIAYILGRGQIKLVLLTPEVTVEKYYRAIGALQHEDDYKGDEEFKEAMALTEKRLASYVSDGDSPVKQEGVKSTGKLAANEGQPTPSASDAPEANASSAANTIGPEVAASNTTKDDASAVLDHNTVFDADNESTANAATNPQDPATGRIVTAAAAAAAAAAADADADDDDDDDDSATVDLIPNAETNATKMPSAVDTSGQDEGTVDSLLTENSTGQTEAPEETKKRKRKGGSKGNGGKKPKTAAKTPAKAASTTNGKKAKASTVSPSPTKVVATDDDISKMISPVDESYTVITHDEAWKLLQSYYGLTLVDGRYYIPSQERPVATTLAGLRKDLCIKGLPPSISELTVQQRVEIARWVRYANVSGLADGQTITPDDLGKPMNQFMNAWPILTRGDKKVFTGNGADLEVQRHFARSGIPCIPTDVSEDILSKKDRLSLEIFFATPRYKVLNTFEREVPGAGRRKKKVNYSEN